MLRYICILCFVSYNTALTYTCCDTCCFFKCLFILVCRSKSPTELMFQNTLSMSISKRRICVYRSINTFTSFRDQIMCLSMFEDLDSVINMSIIFKILVNHCQFLAFRRGKSPTWLMLVYSTQNNFSLFMSMSISKLS